MFVVVFFVLLFFWGWGGSNNTLYIYIICNWKSKCLDLYFVLTFVPILPSLPSSLAAREK